MKKLILLFTFLFSVSSAFVGCKDASQQEEEVVENDLGTDEPETAEVDTDFDEYDANADGLWDENEFGEANNDNFTEWDSDADGAFDNDEFYDSTFETADRNNDDGIDEQEWSEGYNNAFGDYAEEGDFATYDENDDGILDNEEWSTGFADSDWFNDYDADDNDLVENNEWNRGLFDDWDDDESGYLEDQEYDLYNNYYAGTNW